MAYHYFIGRDGTVKQAHDDEYICDNSGNWIMNQRSIAICLAGDFTQEEPTNMQIVSLAKLITDIQMCWGIPDERVILHREVTPKHTVCPAIDLRHLAFNLRREKMTERLTQLQKSYERSDGPRKAKISRLIDRIQKFTPTYPVSI